MKRIVALLLVAIMALSLAACGGKETPNNPSQSQGGENKGGTKIEDVNTENWVAVVAENYGLELSLPDGCSITSATTVNQLNDVRIMFTPGGEEKFKAFGEILFAELLKDATSEIKNSLSEETYSSFAQAYEKAGGIMSLFVSVGGDKSLSIGYYDNGGSVELQLVRSGTWN